MFFAVSLVFMASGCSIPFVYLVPYALSSGVSHQHAAFLMSILGIIDIVGNITVGWLTDRRSDDDGSFLQTLFSIHCFGFNTEILVANF